MISLLSFFSWFGDMGNVIMYGLIAVIVVVCIVMMSKYEGSRKVLGYICALVICVSGVYSAFGLHEEINNKSYIVGELELRNQFSTESYSYNVSSLTLYLDENEENRYSCKVETEKVEDFNGIEKQYTVTFNDYILHDHIVYTAGSVYIKLNYDFYGINGNVDCSVELNILVKFLSNKTTLEVWCYGLEESSYIQQYFADYGFRLAIIEEL